MIKKTKSLIHLKPGEKAKIISLEGGRNFQKRMCILGIRKDQIISIISKQPLMGPLTISVGKTKMTIGRGMAHKIKVEEI